MNWRGGDDGWGGGDKGGHPLKQILDRRMNICTGMPFKLYIIKRRMAKMNSFNFIFRTFHKVLILTLIDYKSLLAIVL